MEDVENVDVYDIFENDIEAALAEYEENPKNMVETDLKHEKPQTWDAALMYVYRRVFKNSNILKCEIDRDNPNTIMPSNYNKYNIDTVDEVVDIYINLCNRYNKVVTVQGFYYMTGITRQTISEWSKGVTSKSYDIHEKLHNAGEQSTYAHGSGGGGNPVIDMARLNRYYGYNGSGTVASKEAGKQVQIENAKQGFLEYQQAKAIESK